MESNSHNSLRATTTLAYALMAGLAFFMVIVYYLNTSGQGLGSGALISPTTDLLVVGGFGLMCLTMSRIVSGKILTSFPQERRRDYDDALGTYRSGIIVRLALLEGAGLMATVFALVTGNLNLLLVGAFMLMMMWLGKPSETEFAEWRG